MVLNILEGLQSVSLHKDVGTLGEDITLTYAGYRDFSVADDFDFSGGIIMPVLRERKFRVQSVQKSRDDTGRVTTIQALSEDGLLMNYAPSRNIVYMSLSESQYIQFTYAVRLEMGTPEGELDLTVLDYCPRINANADYWGRGGWTFREILADICSEMSINHQCNIPDFDVKQLRIDSTSSYLDAVLGLVGVFEPYIDFFDNTLFILERGESLHLEEYAYTLDGAPISLSYNDEYTEGKDAEQFTLYGEDGPKPSITGGGSLGREVTETWTHPEGTSGYTRTYIPKGDFVGADIFCMVSERVWQSTERPEGEANQTIIMETEHQYEYFDETMDINLDRPVLSKTTTTSRKGASPLVDVKRKTIEVDYDEDWYLQKERHTEETYYERNEDDYEVRPYDPENYLDEPSDDVWGKVWHPSSVEITDYTEVTKETYGVTRIRTDYQWRLDTEGGQLIDKRLATVFSDYSLVEGTNQQNAYRDTYGGRNTEQISMSWGTAPQECPPTVMDVPKIERNLNTPNIDDLSNAFYYIKDLVLKGFSTVKITIPYYLDPVVCAAITLFDDEDQIMGTIENYTINWDQDSGYTVSLELRRNNV